jgi:hypothetical protein
MHWVPEDATPFDWGLVFSLGDDTFGLGSQIAIGSDGLVYRRSHIDNFAEWHYEADERYYKKNDAEAFQSTVNGTLEAQAEIQNDHEQRIFDLENAESGGNYVEQIEYNSTDGSLQGRVYVVDKTNTQTTKELRTTSKNDSIPLRNARGNFYVGTPSLALECTNKQYVDNAIAALKAELINGDEESY